MGALKNLIEWKSETASRSRRCSVCGEVSTMPAVLATAHTLTDHGDITAYRCPGCQSLDIEGSFTDFEELPSVTWDHYLQIGAGPAFMFRPLERVGLIKGGSLLDVGCGCGFTLDYWTRVAKGRAVGLEPAAYGDLGISELGVRILKHYLADSAEITGEKFDRIMSSEVIEHVPDPLQFLKELKSYLKENGIVVLTTPNAGYIQPDKPLGVVRSALSPGLHQFLLSAEAFENLLTKAGFKYHIVSIENERLVAYASDTPLKLADDRDKEMDNLLVYLRSRIADSADGSSLGLGARYRLFRELVNTAKFDDAEAVGRDLLVAVRARYAFDPLDLSASRERVLSVSDLDSYGKAAPFFLPCLLFYVGMLAAHGRKLGDATPEAIFCCAADLCGDSQRVNGDISQEAASLYWFATFEEGFRFLINGEHSKALSVFERVIEGPRADEPHLLFCERSEALVTRAVIQSGVAKLQTRRPEEAMLLLRSAMDRVGPEGDLSLARDALRLWKESEVLARKILPGWLTEDLQALEPNSLRRAARRATIVSRILGRR